MTQAQVTRPVLILVAALAAAVAINPVVILFATLVDAICMAVAVYAIFQIKKCVPLSAFTGAVGLSVFWLVMMTIISTPVYLTSLLIDLILAIAAFISLIPLIQFARKGN